MKNRLMTRVLSAALAAGIALGNMTGCAGSGRPAEADPQAEEEALEEVPAEEEAAEDEAPQTDDVPAPEEEETEEIPGGDVFTEFTSFSVHDLYGNEVDESVFSGTGLTMINIWATFCGPCLGEMPDLADLAWDYEPARFQIIGIPLDVMASEDEADPDMKEYALQLIDETGADYTHLLPEHELIGLLGRVQYVPTTVFVDEKGRQVGEAYVGSRSREEWKAIVDSLLVPEE